jgi:hypothetical protein
MKEGKFFVGFNLLRSWFGNKLPKEETDSDILIIRLEKEFRWKMPKGILPEETFF